jgi:hypothetical protein
MAKVEQSAMSLEQYPWDLEERVEDALVAYLKTKCADLVAMIVPAYTVQKVRYPLIVVEAQASDNHNDDAEFSGRRQMDVVVAITTEAVNESAGLLPENARERHRAVKSKVLGYLASRNKLQDDLNAMGQAGVLFSLAHLTAQGRDVGGGKIVTEQTLDVIAQPLEV